MYYQYTLPSALDARGIRIAIEHCPYRIDKLYPPRRLTSEDQTFNVVQIMDEQIPLVS